MQSKRFHLELAEGKPASALITFIKGDNLSRLPRWLLLPLLKWYLQKEKQTLLPNDIPMEALIPIQRFDGLLVKEMDGSLEHFAAWWEAQGYHVKFFAETWVGNQQIERSFFRWKLVRWV